jgi:glyoxylate reductase
MPAVLVTRGVPEPVREHLAGRCELEVWDGEGVMPRAELLDRVAGKAGLVAMLTDRVDGELLDRAGPGLRVVANYAVGFDNLDLDACTARGVLATNTPDVVTEATADLGCWPRPGGSPRATGSCGPGGPGSGGRSSSSGSRSTARLSG